MSHFFGEPVVHRKMPGMRACVCGSREQFCLYLAPERRLAHEHVLLRRNAAIDYRARTRAARPQAQPAGIGDCALGGPCGTLRRTALRPRRSLRGRARTRNPDPLRRADNRPAHRPVRGAGDPLRARSRAHRGCGGGVEPGALGRDRRRVARRHRAAPAGAVPPAQPRAWRNRGARRHARGPARRARPSQRPRRRRRRFRAAVLHLVQPGIPGPAPHRLVDAGHHSREDHPLRGRA